MTVATHCPEVALTDWLAGQEIAGLVLSTTVTVKEQVREFPEASVAVIVTVVAPRLMVVPDAGDWDSVGEAVQLSVEVVEAV